VTEDSSEPTGVPRAAAALTSFAARMSGVRGRATLDATACEVLAAFRVAGVDALLLKGPALARLLYAEGETRGYSDVDLLVSPADLPSARAALAEAGYHDVSGALGIDDVAGILHAETWVGSDPQGHQTVDLHLRLPGARAPVQAAWDALVAHRTSIDLAGQTVPVLDRVGLAVHLATHAAQHGTGHAKALVDLQLGLERWPAEVWRDAAQLADEIDATAAFATGLRVVAAGAELSAELGLPSTAGLEWELANREARPRGTFHVEAWRNARGLRERADLLRRALLPSREWIAYTHPWAQRRGPYLLAAYVLHIGRCPLWATRAWRFRRQMRSADG